MKLTKWKNLLGNLLGKCGSVLALAAVFVTANSACCWYTISQNFHRKLKVSESARMIEKLAERLTVRQIERGIIGESQKAVYKYGYIVLVEMSINGVLTLIVGILSGQRFLVISCRLIFIPLRSYSAGCHSARCCMCMLFSV